MNRERNVKCSYCGSIIPAGAKCPCQGGKIYSSNAPVNAIKTLGASGLFLIATILTAASNIIFLLSQLIFKNNLFGENAFEEYGRVINRWYNARVDYFNFINLIVMLLPGVVTVVGLLLIYFTCRNTETGSAKTVGFTMLKVINTIKMICFILFAAILIIMSIASIFISINFDDTGLPIFALMIISALISAIGLAFYLAKIRAINNIKRTIITGEVPKKISGFLIFLMIASGIITTIIALFTMTLNPATSVRILCSGVSSIIFGYLLKKYKSIMTTIYHTQPAETAPPMASPGNFHIHPDYGQPISPPIHSQEHEGSVEEAKDDKSQDDEDQDI